MSIVFDFPSINRKLYRREQKAEFEAKDTVRKAYEALSGNVFGSAVPFAPPRKEA